MDYVSWRASKPIHWVIPWGVVIYMESWPLPSVHDFTHDGGWRTVQIPHWPLPGVRNLTCDGRWSTYNVSVPSTQAVQCFIPGKMRTHGKHSKGPSTTKLARLGHFPSALPARCSMNMSFLWLYKCTYDEILLQLSVLGFVERNNLSHKNDSVDYRHRVVLGLVR